MSEQLKQQADIAGVIAAKIFVSASLCNSCGDMKDLIQSSYAPIFADLTAAKQRIDELEKDKARLDWLSKAIGMIPELKLAQGKVLDMREHSTLSLAIDSAMRKDRND